ncbi:MAG: hypothetical protein JSR58_05340 [Verrucomicrobia bacterium]|nr:hypothetical protein [Verrucomicrobiota bacterium]
MATNVAPLFNPHKPDYVVNEIKVVSLDVCTGILLFNAIHCLVIGSIPLSLPFMIFTGGALLGRVVIERSMNPKIYERPGDWFKNQLAALKLYGGQNTRIPDMKGWTLFYLSPWLKEQFIPSPK